MALSVSQRGAVITPGVVLEDRDRVPCWWQETRQARCLQPAKSCSPCPCSLLDRFDIWQVMVGSAQAGKGRSGHVRRHQLESRHPLHAYLADRREPLSQASSEHRGPDRAPLHGPPKAILFIWRTPCFRRDSSYPSVKVGVEDDPSSSHFFQSQQCP